MTGVIEKSCSTTLVSAMVLVSPSSWSFLAIFLNTLRIILPERVLGRPGALCMASGAANLPIFSRTTEVGSVQTIRARIIIKYSEILSG